MTPRRYRRLRRLDDLAGIPLAILVGFAPYLLALAILGCSDYRKARGDASRETHTEAPEFRGVRANAPIPPHLHKRNEGGSDGAGLCVICSITINGRYQQVPGIEGLWPVAKRRPGGYSPTKLQGLVDEILPTEKWASYVGTDASVLDRMSAMGYPIGITMNTGDLYGGRPIHHMVSNTHFDSKADLACYVDNNQPGVYVWTTAREAARRWIDGGTGWAFVWLRRAASNSDRSALVIFAAAGVLVALVIRRARAPIPTPEHEGDP